MNQVAWPQSLQRRGADLQVGMVRLIKAGTCWIEVPQGLCPADKAATCLIEPQVGDKVLIFSESAACHYLLAILGRASDDPAAMVFDKGVTLEIRAGAFDVTSPSIRLASQQELALSSQKLEIRAQEADALIQHAAISGVSLTSTWDKIKTVAQSIEIIADRWLQKLVRSYRTIADFEESKIGRLRCLVKGISYTKSKKVIISAEETAKIEASKIIIG